LDDAKIPYEPGAGGGTILVPSDKVYQIRMQLAGKGIPRRGGDGVGFEIFETPSFGISDFVQRVNYARAVQGELARSIMCLDEIESARVMVVQPERPLITDKDKHATASVLVKVRGNGQLAPQAINSIRFLVANSVEGLKPNFVSVVDTQGNTLSENVENDSLAGTTATQFDVRRNLEQYYAKKAEDMLQRVFGPGQAIVKVAAEINFDTLQRTEEKFDPDGQVVKTKQKDESSEDSTTAASNEGVGVSANTPGNSPTNSPSTPSTFQKNKKLNENVEYENAKIISNLIQAPGAIKRLSAAVTVAQTPLVTGPNGVPLPRDTNEVARLEKIEKLVSSVVGIDLTRGDQITVQELPFSNPVAAELTRSLDVQQKHDFYWTLARNLGYPALALGILLGFVRAFKRTSNDDIPIGVPVGRMGAHGGNGNGNGNHFGFGEDGESGDEVVTVQVLNQLIKENPQNMTNAIRAWLTRGAPPPK
jgi:flagellar M-ring protein FliF